MRSCFRAMFLRVKYVQKFKISPTWTYIALEPQVHYLSTDIY